MKEQPGRIEEGWQEFRRAMELRGTPVPDDCGHLRVAFAAGAAWALLLLELATEGLKDGKNQPVN